MVTQNIFAHRAACFLCGLLWLVASDAHASSATVPAGANVTLAAAADGTAPFSYQWFKDGSVLSAATAATYRITGFQADSAGVYTTLITNSAGDTTTENAAVSLAAAPVITVQPVGLTVAPGSPVQFAVGASANPSPAYQWRKNGLLIDGATSATYAIGSVTDGDAGTFSVVVSNTLGSVQSNGAALVVAAAKSTLPVIVAQPATQTVTKGSTVTFKVEASGSGLLTYYWLKNGAKIRKATGTSYSIASVAAGDAGAYSVVVTNSYGTVTSSSAVLTVKTTTAPIVYRVDFNGDGKSDILWQNGVTGECSVWLMAGTAVSSKVSLGVGPAGLKICGTGDFNADGKTDILWQNGVTGECSVWLMNGTSVTSTVTFGSVTTDWQLCGSGDFNGDGKSDLVWQNRVTDECAVWLMSGTGVSRVVSLGQAPADLELIGTGDFNKDGQSDILWQNAVTGEYGVWLMAGTSVGSRVLLGTVSLDWQMSGAGDYNADLQSDLLWQNLLTGETSIWLMNGTAVSSKISLGTVPTYWMLRN